MLLLHPQKGQSTIGCAMYTSAHVQLIASFPSYNCTQCLPYPNSLFFEYSGLAFSCRSDEYIVKFNVQLILTPALTGLLVELHHMAQPHRYCMRLNCSNRNWWLWCILFVIGVIVNYDRQICSWWIVFETSDRRWPKQYSDVKRETCSSPFMEDITTWRVHTAWADRLPGRANTWLMFRRDWSMICMHLCTLSVYNLPPVFQCGSWVHTALPWPT